MIVGTEWLIEAFGCDPAKLREIDTLRSVFDKAVADLGLKVLGAPQWHKFGGEGGVTGLMMLTESHLACHTYPEYGTATFNLYCCRSRPEWDWESNLRKLIGATHVSVTRLHRGDESDSAPTNPKSQAVGGEN